MPDNNRNDRGRDRNSNVGTAVGAGALGAVAGALLSSRFNNQNLYQQGYNYPDYGQRGYGDPRSDPRFAQGGWGYGNNGRWVPIERRADWLDGRIEDGQRNGGISRREARDLRSELNDLIQQERRYGRNGLGNRERAYLDDRFDSLAARVRYERRDNDNRPYDYNRDNNRGSYNNNYNNSYNRGY